VGSFQRWLLLALLGKHKGVGKKQSSAEILRVCEANRQELNLPFPEQTLFFFSFCEVVSHPPCGQGWSMKTG